MSSWAACKAKLRQADQRRTAWETSAAAAVAAPSELAGGWPLVAPPPYARARKVHSSGTEGPSASLAGGELRSPATPAPPPIKARQKNLEALLRWARIRPASLFSLQQQPAAATPKGLCNLAVSFLRPAKRILQIQRLPDPGILDPDIYNGVRRDYLANHQPAVLCL